MKNLNLFSIIVVFFYGICYSEENSIYCFDANENLFTAYAFMNAAGFDHDWSEMHQIRIEIRDYLDKNLCNELRAKMNDFYNKHGSGDFSSYGIYALLLFEPPEFIIKYDTLKQKDFLKEYDGLDDLYREFYEKANIKELWIKYKPIIQEMNDGYKPFAKIALNDIIKYCKLEKDYFSKRASKIYFTICPQMSHFTAYTTEVNGNIYIIHGPSEDKPSPGAFYHEALHHVINPLTEKHMNLVNQYNKLLEVTNDKRYVGYNDWQSNVDDSFCRTISMVLSGIHPGNSNEDINSWVQNEYKFGFILCMHILEKLHDYENSGKTFEEFYPTFYNTINIEKEKTRWEEFWKNNKSNVK
jgi:hypothetical protein